MMKSYVEYKMKKGRLGSLYDEQVKAGMIKFLKNEENLYHNLSENEKRNYDRDVEACYLSHGIWAMLMNNNKIYSSNFFYYSKDKKGNPLAFHFDIMNNSNEKNWRLQNQKVSIEKLERLKNIYHSIGNITPIPWFKVDDGRFINGQLLHKALNERWDLYLKTLKFNWKVWNIENPLTFEEYMILTCQQMYYEEIFNIVRDKEVKDIKIEDVMFWNNKIKESSALISFFSDENKSIDVVIDIIIKLIEIRCRVIYLLLKNKKIEI